MKNFSEWLKESDSSSPYDIPSFFEMYEDVIIDLEKRLQKEGVLEDPDKFFESIQELGVEYKFEDDVEQFVGDRFDKMYYGKWNDDMDEFDRTPEYERVISLANQTWNSGLRSAKSRHINKLLVKNLIEKHWEEYKKLYMHWIDYVHRNRGTLSGKRYGI